MNAYKIVDKLLEADKGAEADRLYALMQAGHGKVIGSCGHVIRQCRCPHGAELEQHTLSPCPACMKKKKRAAQSFG